MEIVEVVWEDAWSESASLRQEAIDNLEPILRSDVGYLTKKNKRVMVISGGTIKKGSDGKDTFTDNKIFPMGIVKKVFSRK